MRKLVVLLLICMSSSLLCEGQQIDTEKSVVQFSVRNFGVNQVKGSFSGMNGEIHFDPSQPTQSRFSVCIDAKSIRTKIKKRDRVLRGEKYFDTENYPEICFHSSSVVRQGMNYKISGTLSMHGVNQNVDILFYYSRKLFTGKLIINRLDFGIGPKSGAFVGKEVEITIYCYIR